MRLNPLCSELRGAENPNKVVIIVRLPREYGSLFQFVDPACRDRDDLRWKSLAEYIKFNFFSEMTEDLISYSVAIQRANTAILAYSLLK